MKALFVLSVLSLAAALSAQVAAISAPAAKPSSAPTPKIALTFAPSPPAAGRSEQVTLLVTKAGKPLSGAKITADITMTAMQMRPQHPDFKAVGAGRYTALVTFGMGGSWKIAVHIKAPGAAKPVTVATAFSVGM